MKDELDTRDVIRLVMGADAVAPAPEDIVKVCSWCLAKGAVRILDLHRGPRDTLALLIGPMPEPSSGRKTPSLEIRRNGRELAISHGMCGDCFWEHMAESAEPARPSAAVLPISLPASQGNREL
jgi:hypothetical protein